MFFVLLRFSANKARAGDFMDAHKAWIKRGFDEGVFLLVGTLRPDQGGCVVAHNTSLADLQQRVSEDPFVAEDVVRAEILEIAPARVDARLEAVLARAAA
ncbi:MAG TPA: YciI family protein [Alphaproteobacteria bacterium]